MSFFGDDEFSFLDTYGTEIGAKMRMRMRVTMNVLG